MTVKQNPRVETRAVQYSDMVSTSEFSTFTPQNQPQFFWNTRSNSVELLNHWIACRGHRFGYAEVSE